MTSINNTL